MAASMLTVANTDTLTIVSAWMYFDMSMQTDRPRTMMEKGMGIKGLVDY